MQNDIYEFYKENEHNQIWEVEHYIIIDTTKKVAPDNVDGIIGELLFSFDKKKIYNLWKDYPYNFTEEEIKIFDKEQPYWAEFFKKRKEK